MENIEGCKCEGFYKKEYFDLLKTTQSLREELDEKNKIIETYEILLNKDAMDSIKQSLIEFSEGKGISLSELDDAELGVNEHE